jgi:hypothetical protein
MSHLAQNVPTRANQIRFPAAMLDEKDDAYDEGKDVAFRSHA